MSDIKHEFLKQRRQEMGIPLTEMARAVGLTRQQYNRIENGLNNPRLPRLRAICHRLKIPVGDVILAETVLPQAEQIA